MTSLRWMHLTGAMMALFLAVGYWHQLYEPGGWLHRYMGPIWLLTALLNLATFWKLRFRGGVIER